MFIESRPFYHPLVLRFPQSLSFFLSLFLSTSLSRFFSVSISVPSVFSFTHFLVFFQLFENDTQSVNVEINISLTNANTHGFICTKNSSTAVYENNCSRILVIFNFKFSITNFFLHHCKMLFSALIYSIR